MLSAKALTSIPPLSGFMIGGTFLPVYHLTGAALTSLGLNDVNRIHFYTKRLLSTLVGSAAAVGAAALAGSSIVEALTICSTMVLISLLASGALMCFLYFFRRQSVAQEAQQGDHPQPLYENHGAQQI